MIIVVLRYYVRLLCDVLLSDFLKRHLLCWEGCLNYRVLQRYLVLLLLRVRQRARMLYSFVLLEECVVLVEHLLLSRCFVLVERALITHLNAEYVLKPS